jgi:hypothetical protein
MFEFGFKTKTCFQKEKKEGKEINKRKTPSAPPLSRRPSFPGPAVPCTPLLSPRAQLGFSPSRPTLRAPHAQPPPHGPPSARPIFPQPLVCRRLAGLPSAPPPSWPAQPPSTRPPVARRARLCVDRSPSRSGSRRSFSGRQGTSSPTVRVPAPTSPTRSRA